MMGLAGVRSERGQRAHFTAGDTGQASRQPGVPGGRAWGLGPPQGSWVSSQLFREVRGLWGRVALWERPPCGGGTGVLGLARAALRPERSGVGLCGRL